MNREIAKILDQIRKLQNEIPQELDDDYDHRHEDIFTALEESIEYLGHALHISKELKG